MRALFEHRSGRIIALGRLILAAVFMLALWLDPGQPMHGSGWGYAPIGIYLATSMGLMALAMKSWWWDHRLAWPVLAFDIFAFLAAVFVTESVNSDFTSPFLAFFSFVMLTATIRWDWRVTAAAGLLVTTLYLLVGVGISLAAADFDVFRLGRRFAYMLLLLLILVWFGLQRREQHIERFSDAHDPSAGLLPPLEGALAFAMEQCGASAGALAWSDSEEPGIEVRTMAIRSPGDSLDPSVLSSDRAFGDKVRMFSTDRCRSLRASSRGRPIASGQELKEPLADRLGIGEALALPFTGGAGRGEIIVTGISGMCADHVMIGQLVAREVQAAFDRHAAMVLTHETALARSRNALARDLHDNVAQSLAGAALRLEGLRKSIRAGHDPDSEILQLKEALRAEQKEVRGMIDRLRFSEQVVPVINLPASITRLVTELSANWGVTIDFEPEDAIELPATLAYEVSNLVREAVANAVRHGSAGAIKVGLRRETDWITIAINDNGSGFSTGTGAEAPRSIRERVARHGGTFAVQTGTSGTQLKIGLPMGEAA